MSRTGASEIPGLLAEEPAGGEQNAQATGMLRVSGYRVGGFFVAATGIGAHERATANALRGAGVGLAVVCDPQPNDVRACLGGNR